MWRFASVLLLGISFVRASIAQQSVGVFAEHTDVGQVLHPGSTTYDAKTGTYTLRGSGTNMWSTEDAFQFAWKKVSGDVALSALVQFPDTRGNEHKKAVLILRQSLDADSVYVDIALHGNGLLALQYRDEKGGTTSEVKSATTATGTVTFVSGKNQSLNKIASGLFRLIRRGNYAYMSLGSQGSGGAFAYDGESIRIPLEGDFYVGIGVCAHDKDASEEATFSNVELKTLPPATAQPIVYS